jgi:hypothetical protein
MGQRSSTTVLHNNTSLDKIKQFDMNDSYGSLVLINKQDPTCIKITQITFKEDLEKIVVFDDSSIYRIRPKITTTTTTTTTDCLPKFTKDAKDAIIDCLTDFNPDNKLFMYVLDENNEIACVSINNISDKKNSKCATDDLTAIKATLILADTINTSTDTSSICNTVIKRKLSQNIVTGKIIKYNYIPNDENVELIITKSKYICLATQKCIYISDINGMHIKNHPINVPNIIIIDINFDDEMNIIIFFSKRRRHDDKYFEKIDDADPNCDLDARNYIYSIEYLGKIMEISYKFFTNESQHDHYPLMTLNDHNGLHLYNLDDLFNIITFVGRQSNPVSIHKISPNKKYIAYIMNDNLFVTLMDKKQSVCKYTNVQDLEKILCDTNSLKHAVSIAWHPSSTKLIVCCFDPNNNKSNILMYSIKDYTHIYPMSPVAIMPIISQNIVNDTYQIINVTLIGNIEHALTYYDMTVNSVYWCDN